MEKGDDISKICLMIAYEQNISSGKIFNIFSTGNFESIDPDKSRVGDNAHNGIYYCPDDANPFELIIK